MLRAVRALRRVARVAAAASIGACGGEDTLEFAKDAKDMCARQRRRE